MSGMRSLAPSLVTAGWENFFLDLRHDLELSDQRTQQLYQLREEYLDSSE
jgi:hypothetical protein